ncbi:MAG: hypothetical protein QGH11_05415 [Pirellulaceae bacterium]|nr:hypothetical protein [Pirellulaceae bacterium]
MPLTQRGIQAYNIARDVPAGTPQGYDETTPCALVQRVHVTLVVYDEMLPVAGSRTDVSKTRPGSVAKPE